MKSCVEQLSVPPNIEPFTFQDGLAEGMRTRTVCGVSKGDAPLSLKWLKDGEPLSSLLGANVSTLDQYSSLLNIPSLSAAHSGDYTCVASNPAAEVKFTASLQVKGKVKSCHCLQQPHPFLHSFTFKILRCIHIIYIFNLVRAIITTIVCPFPVALARSGFAADHQVIVFVHQLFLCLLFLSFFTYFFLSFRLPSVALVYPESLSNYTPYSFFDRRRPSLNRGSSGPLKASSSEPNRFLSILFCLPPTASGSLAPNATLSVVAFHHAHATSSSNVLSRRALCDLSISLLFSSLSHCTPLFLFCSCWNFSLFYLSVELACRRPSDFKVACEELTQV